MLQDVQAIGLSYRQTPLELRQLLTMSKEVIADKLIHLKQYCNVREAAILSTCNRTEVYFLSGEIECVSKWMSLEVNQDITPYLYSLQHQSAIAHLFRVTSGLDSQMIGEHEIVGQVKKFSELARHVGTSGIIINRLLERSLTAAKEVRAFTKIGHHSTSYAVLAKRMASAIFNNLKDCSVLFIGTGDMTISGGVVFSREHFKHIAIVSRNLDKAEKIATRFNAEVIALSRLAEVLPKFDIIITATGSQVPIIGKGAVERALKIRKQKPIMFADLALPNDLEPEIKKLPNTFVYNLDQFATLEEHSNEQRALAAEQAEPIIQRHVNDFLSWLNERDKVPKIRSYREQSLAIKNEEIKRSLAYLERGDNPEAVLKQAINRISGKMMHLPTQWILEGDNQRKDGSDDESTCN